MNLLVIRHGQSEADILNVHEGRADFALTELGLKQVDAMAQWVKDNYTIDKIYSSTLIRAKQTAEALSKICQVSVLYDEDLMEFNNGLIAGLPYEEAKEKFPIIQDLPLHIGPYGMESKLEFQMRGQRAFSKIISNNSADSTIAVVTHGGLIQKLLYTFFNLPMESPISFATGDTGIHLLQYTKEKRVVVYMNRTEHLSKITSEK